MRSGFEAVYLSGAAIAYTRLGAPDIGLVSMAEVAETLSLVRERVEAPIIVDGDTGYGNALNVARTVRAFEQAGASAIQLEDQSFPKRCGHLSDKTLIPATEMAGKLRAAVDARRSDKTLIIARTDAVASEGFDAAVERARLYADSGADVLFVEAPRTREQLAAVKSALGNRLPLMANMVEGGQTPVLSAQELEGLGFRLVIFPGGIVRAIARTAQAFYEVLARDGVTDAFRDRMFDFEALNDLLGTKAMLERGRSYEGAPASTACSPGEGEGMTVIDPVTLAVLKGRLEQIADEMDATLYRSAFNPIIAEARDACHGLYHAETGATLVQGAKGLADLRRRHGLRGEGRHRQGRSGTAAWRRATPFSSTILMKEAPISTISASCGRSGDRERSSPGSLPSAIGSTSAAMCRAASTLPRPRASRRAFAFRP